MNNQNTIDAAKQLLDLAVIRKSYANEIERLTGARFNVFEIWGDSASEVKHSAFLAELLNSEGSHGMGDAFVSLFVEMLNDCISMSKGNRKELEFDTKTCHSKCEHNIGNGRIDILLSDSEERKIIIENKIYAEDQFEQLSRYHEHGTESQKSFELIYLTLRNQEASVHSRKNLTLDEHYYNITYSEHIINWLDKCAKEAVQKPLVRETIQQYLYLLKKMTNQTASDDLKAYFTKLLKENKDYYFAVHELESAKGVIKEEVKEAFFRKIKQFVDENRLIIRTKDYNFLFHAGENSHSFFYGCTMELHNGEQPEQKVKDFYHNKLKGKTGTKKFAQLGNWIGWSLPHGGSIFKFKNYVNYASSEDFYKLITDEGIEEFVERSFRVEMRVLIKNIQECLKDEAIG